MEWNRTRARWAAGLVVAATAGTVALVTTTGSDAHRADLPAQITDRMRTTLEQSDPGQHNHAGHQATTAQDKPAVICGVRVYGYEPAGVSTLADVRTVYGFHLCGVAEQGRPWDVAVKLAGPVILDLSTEPPGIRVVEATAGTSYADRLRQMFPPKYVELAQKEALSDREMAGLRSRYDAAAGL
ncbi:hypothetical protein [Actinoplanes sp. NPDC049316]|uniref:hypothetical protein n=1 Tax=Actinoplanes sp. NPDC049316 TaxID=3154727 RepID=UPI0034242658